MCTYICPKSKNTIFTKYYMRKYSIFVIIAVVVAGLLLTKSLFFPAPTEDQSKGKGPGGKGNTALNVEIMVLKSQKAANNIQSTGTILPNERVELAAEGSGKVIGIYFKEGAFVKAGQLLVKLNDADIKAQLSKAKVALKLSQDQASRQEKLLALQGTSKEDYDIAQNQVLSYQSDISYYNTLILKTEIRAPFSGIVGFRSIALGSYVSPSTVVASLQQLNPIKIEFTAPEKYLNNFKVGQLFTFNAESSNQPLTAKVATIDPQIDLNTRSVTIRGIAENKSNLLPGNFVKVNIDVTKNAQVIKVPTSSVVPILKGQKVYVLKNGKAVEKIIEISDRDDKFVQVDKGLAQGDSLIVTGIIMLKEGMDVKPSKVL